MRRILVLLVLAACRRAPTAHDAAPPAAPDAPAGREIVRIDDMAVTVPMWPREAGPPIEGSLVARRLWEGLTQSPLFALRGAVPAADAAGVRVRRARLRVTVGVQLVREPKKPVVIRGAVNLALDWAVATEDRDLSQTDACETELPPRADVAAVAVQAVECAAARAAAGLIARENIRRGDKGAVLAALAGDDAAARQAAFAAVADQHIVAAVPRLLELLSAEDPFVRDGAIGALVALREPRAIKPLTELGQFHDLGMMRRVIDAIATIGGEEAHAYLEMVAGGHEVNAIRELAKQALERMDRKERRD